MNKVIKINDRFGKNAFSVRLRGNEDDPEKKDFFYLFQHGLRIEHEKEAESHDKTIADEKMSKHFLPQDRMRFMKIPDEMPARKFTIRKRVGDKYTIFSKSENAFIQDDCVPSVSLDERMGSRYLGFDFVDFETAADLLFDEAMREKSDCKFQFVSHRWGYYQAKIDIVCYHRA